jgi:hypothetical protein
MQHMPSRSDYHQAQQNPQPQPQPQQQPAAKPYPPIQLAQNNCKNNMLTCNCLQSLEPCKQYSP